MRMKAGLDEDLSNLSEMTITNGRLSRVHEKHKPPSESKNAPKIYSDLSNPQIEAVYSPIEHFPKIGGRVPD